MVATFEWDDYKEGLTRVANGLVPQIMIANSPADLPPNLGGNPVSLDCAPSVACVAVIPDKTTGIEREASDLVLDLIRRNLPRN